ncbi:MAG TPA: hypothetical protein VFL47_01820 [Flavisolibacter sp.]|nr:hypothetical protein [Flavisolibacter sp.]
MTIFLYLSSTAEAYTWFLQAAYGFIAGVAGLLFSVFVFRKQRFVKQQKKAALRLLFSDLIAETVVCESQEEIDVTLQTFLATNGKLLQKPFARDLLVKEIVKTKDDISGSSAENLRLLFEKLNLDKDCYQRFRSKQWHVKARAIQQLAEMQQSQYLVKIYRETNHQNKAIRTEAQLAVVKLTGFKGLRFLNIVSHPVSQWQQLSLLHQLNDSAADESNLRKWLSSENETVVEFALRLAEAYQCYALHDDVLACLQHTSAAVRHQALLALREVSNDSTPTALIHYFFRATKQEQLLILDLLGDIGSADTEIGFLETLQQCDDEMLRHRAGQALQQIRPASTAVSLLSGFSKQAV